MTCSLCILVEFSCDKVSVVATVIFSSAYLLYRDKPFFGYLKICLARSVVLSILCHDNLMCVYWNSYVATLTIVLPHYLCAAFSNLCRNPVYYVATVFLLVLGATIFLVLSSFLSRPGKFVMTESCLHLT